MTEEVKLKAIHDCSTGVTEYVPLTAEELAEMATVTAQIEAEQLAIEAEKTRIAELKASAKAKLIAGEPLTSDEAQVLLGA
ncbi:MAG: hypothetical protein EBZ87_00705 [Microbacteriaceae bacterium]|nr:hypothetical protein [Microbacteriaceae bacterium]